MMGSLKLGKKGHVIHNCTRATMLSSKLATPVQVDGVRISDLVVCLLLLHGMYFIVQTAPCLLIQCCRGQLSGCMTCVRGFDGP